MPRSLEVWAPLSRRVTAGPVALVREPGSAAPVACLPLSQTIHAAALLQPDLVPVLFRGARSYRRGPGYLESLGRGRRCYDDNAAMALASLQHYLITGELRSLSRAQWIDRFLQAGAIDGACPRVELGEGAHAGATGAVGLVAAALGRDPKPALQALEQLRRSDGIVGQQRRADGSLDTAASSGNQGLLIALAHRAGAKRLLAEAIDAAACYFTDQRLWEQPVACNAVYLRGLAAAGAPLRPMRDYADALWDRGRDERGWCGGAEVDGQRRSRVLDTAAAAQIFRLLEGMDSALIV